MDHTCGSSIGCSPTSGPRNTVGVVSTRSAGTRGAVVAERNTSAAPTRRLARSSVESARSGLWSASARRRQGHAFRGIAGYDVLHRFNFRGIAPDDGKMARPGSALHRLRHRSGLVQAVRSIRCVGRCNIDPTRWAVCHEMWSLSQRSCVRISVLPRGY